MTPKYAISFFLLAIVCSAGFTSAFSSDRLQAEDTKSNEKHTENKKSDAVQEQNPLTPVLKSLDHEHIADHDFVVPDHPAEPHTKRVKVLKRRHVRRRRDRYPELPSDVQDIFSSNPVRRSIGPDILTALQANQYSQFSGYPSISPFQTPGAYHNTFVPNGPQVNNYYSHYQNPLSSSASPNLWQQQGITPFSFPNYPPVAVYFIPIPWCLPAPQTPPVATPTEPETNVTVVEDRFAFPEELPTPGTSTRPKTPTGISFQIATPPRQPSRPLPPIQRNPENSLQTSGEGKIVGQQAYSPPAIQRPLNSLPNPVTSGPSVVEGSNSIGAQSPQVGANVPPCIWAIVSCCPNNKSNMREQMNCFDRLQCPGAFYDTNPCIGDLAKAAEQEAQNFYNRG